MAKSLIHDGHSGAHIIQEHQESLKRKWAELNSLVNERRESLKGAEQVHKFVRDASETNERMSEKVSHMQGTFLTLTSPNNLHVTKHPHLCTLSRHTHPHITPTLPGQDTLVRRLRQGPGWSGDSDSPPR